jgi:hypothetical protein
MKPFEVYQHLDGFPYTERDLGEIGSKFWNEGKFNNFVKPFIKETGKELTFVDMGCNAGLFLNEAENMGFGQVVGVDSNEEAVQKGERWRDDHGKHYKFLLTKMEDCIDRLPLADYTVLANAHYYFTINDWLDYLDKLQYKTRYCIVVTAEKRSKQACWASADVPDIRNYFKGWEEVGFIDELPLEEDPHPRRLWGLCFKSPFIERVELASLDRGNHVQDSFYGQIDKGVPYKDTKYYHIMKPYRVKWSEDHLNKWFEGRVRLFENVKKDGLLRPIYIDSKNRILDGNHKSSIMEYLGYKTIIVRRT